LRLLRRRVVRLLSRQRGLRVIVAGRGASQGWALVDTLRQGAKAELKCVVLDTQAPDFGRAIRAVGPDAVVHTTGPFQGLRHHVARACIVAGAH